MNLQSHINALIVHCEAIKDDCKCVGKPGQCNWVEDNCPACDLKRLIVEFIENQNKRVGYSVQMKYQIYNNCGHLVCSIYAKSPDEAANYYFSRNQRVSVFSEIKKVLGEFKMTNQEFIAKENELLANVPEEFRSAICFYAWQRGHAYGLEEVLNYVAELIDMFKEPIEAYTRRITK